MICNASYRWVPQQVYHWGMQPELKRVTGVPPYDLVRVEKSEAEGVIGELNLSMERDRELVVLRYLPLISRMAEEFNEKIPRRVKMEDLLTSGVAGLFRAFSKFDPEQKDQFDVYVQFCIRGAFLDTTRGSFLSDMPADASTERSPLEDVEHLRLSDPQTKPHWSEADLIDRAAEVIGERSEAMRWLGTPVRALNYATPVSLLHTLEGRQSVLSLLGRIEHGVL